MTTFASAIGAQPARTTNGMKANLNSSNALVDLFYTIGAARNLPTIIPYFLKAYELEPDIAIRIVLYARDIRGGMGERKVFRDILQWLEKNEPDIAMRVLAKVPELGRWDDLVFQYTHEKTGICAMNMIKAALLAGDGLCAKWMPRKGAIAVELRIFMGLSPKQYRKLLVRLTNVVETKMCDNKWDDINYSHVPSIAHSIYRKAFGRHSENYQVYLDRVKTGEDKINAGAIFPHDVLKGVAFIRNKSKQEKEAIDAQWNALPNYIGSANVLPLVDVSGSMLSPVGQASTTSLDVAVSLGLYFADKNLGSFKDCFLTFSEAPQLLKLSGTITRKCEQMVRSKWDMNTNLHKAFDQVLATAIKNGIGQEEMPDTLLILSDMQFDRCVRFDDGAIEMISRKYRAAGYEVPAVVFWNLNAHGNAPARYNDKGVALLSGFSPASVKGVLDMDKGDLDPFNSMMKLIGVERYEF